MDFCSLWILLFLIQSLKFKTKYAVKFFVFDKEMYPEQIKNSTFVTNLIKNEKSPRSIGFCFVAKQL